MQKSHQANASRLTNMSRHDTTENEARTANSTYKKLAVQWLNEVLSRPKKSLQVIE
jgi:hypothetical protein